MIGYQNAAHIAEDADATGSTLREAALRSGKVNAARYDHSADPYDRRRAGGRVARSPGNGRRRRLQSARPSSSGCRSALGRKERDCDGDTTIGPRLRAMKHRKRRSERGASCFALVDMIK